ncbi:TPA: DUF5983 family protein [Salmonella enterica]|uniref:Aec77 n=1 Tax=Salmonella enterica TaxID=28901 RepID=A0A3F3J2X1_SALER|nr:DUF5983 family protein [Salmonella enterica]EBP3673411.1 hypothetical protein [Salmonella enterica subsp. enterica]EDW0433079.1 hypothetical protein [Salmonella enterica subsp. enterica serovar Lexington]EEJ6652656.1 hypothetical protein [Salmonella enterica subsp. enterica serovar Redlands]EAA7899945.1 hypothetical protein [Salmonella enterica]EAA9127959.1 hypothetical protein [Salmonella enterica]
MKLSLTVEADSINVLALNMGRIAVDIDGIELANLIDVVCDNGYSLRIADAPGKLVVEDPLPSVARVNSIKCSTAHITETDNTLLYKLSHQHEDFGESEWILYTGAGYLLHLGAWSFPVLRLKRLGLSKACRRLVITLIRRYSADIIHLDACGEVLPGFATFDW